MGKENTEEGGDDKEEEEVRKEGERAKMVEVEVEAVAAKGWDMRKWEENGKDEGIYPKQ